MSKLLRLGRNVYINLNNIVMIKHYPKDGKFELTTITNQGDGTIILGSGGYNSNCLKYEIKSLDEPDEYNDLKNHLHE
jgi:hypothetical protein